MIPLHQKQAISGSHWNLCQIGTSLPRDHVLPFLFPGGTMLEQCNATPEHWSLFGYHLRSKEISHLDSQILTLSKLLHQKFQKSILKCKFSKKYYGLLFLRIFQSPRPTYSSFQNVWYKYHMGLQIPRAKNITSNN